jgi:hypothetical protein
MFHVASFQLIIPKLRAPVVLVHGLLGYDRITLGRRDLHIVLKEEGSNDGVVSVASATYGERMEVWPGTISAW